jgi:hypothetical protein
MSCKVPCLGYPLIPRCGSSILTPRAFVFAADCSCYSGTNQPVACPELVQGTRRASAPRIAASSDFVAGVQWDYNAFGGNGVCRTTYGEPFSNPDACTTTWGGEWWHGGTAPRQLPGCCLFELSGRWLLGAGAWVAPKLATKATCESGGYCENFPFVGDPVPGSYQQSSAVARPMSVAAQVACAASNSCTYPCPAPCNAKSCQRIFGCSDVYVFNYNGFQNAPGPGFHACYFPYSVRGGSRRQLACVMRVEGRHRRQRVLSADQQRDSDGSVHEPLLSDLL